MAWIRVVPPGDGGAELDELFERVRDPASGRLDNILAVHSLHPAGLDAHFRLYRTVMTPSRSLPKVDRELIALFVSRLNECHY
jgi:alkylhydroperoxidase family enzyme